MVERILHTLGFDLGLLPRVTFREVPGDRGRIYLVPDQLWRVNPPDCFAPLTFCDADGSRRTFDPPESRWSCRCVYLAAQVRRRNATLHAPRRGAVGRYLARRAPHLTEQLRSHWQALVFTADEGWLDEYLIASPQEGRPKPVGRQARARAIQQLADRGLTADEIRQVLRHR